MIGEVAPAHRDLVETTKVGLPDDPSTAVKYIRSLSSPSRAAIPSDYLLPKETCIKHLIATANKEVKAVGGFGSLTVSCKTKEGNFCTQRW